MVRGAESDGWGGQLLDGEGLTLPLMNLAYGEGGCTYVPYGAVDKYGNWVAAADGSVRQMTLPIEESEGVD